MQTLLQQTESILEKEALKFSVHENSNLIELKMELENAVFTVLIICNDRNRYCSIRCIIPNIVPSSKKLLVAELFNRLNHQFIFGCFALDMEDGEMYYQQSFMIPESKVEEEVLVRTLKVVLNTVNDQYAKIMSVMFGNVQPVLAALEMAN